MLATAHMAGKSANDESTAVYVTLAGIGRTAPHHTSVCATTMAGTTTVAVLTAPD